MVLPGSKQFVNFTSGIVKIAKVHTMSRANRNACGEFSFLNPVNTKCTFISVTIGINKARIIGAGSQTSFAADTLVMFNQDNRSGFMNMAGPGRAACYAGSGITMVTPLRLYFDV
jgi:hypothetical protein